MHIERNILMAIVKERRCLGNLIGTIVDTQCKCETIDSILQEETSKQGRWGFSESRIISC